MTCTTNCMLSISCKSSTICSSSDILIVNNSGNVLLIEFALAEGMPELLVFVAINAISMACIVFWYLKEYNQCYHKYNVTCKGCIGEYDQQDLPHWCITYIFQKFLFISYVIFLRFENCNILCIDHTCQYVF